ncbi:leucine-rich repeat domain-containing protein [Prevotella denticola]|uniref:leucine-rich repeat domain-containing protein n=1 Tax=Prevotella denticola TaxID=28129 RepID=UPI002151BBD1|nr:leucine-rich repeat domain-containing protein [Prevotella denticola]
MERWPTFAFNPTALKEIDVDANNSTYCSIDGVVYSKDKKKLIYYPAGKTDAAFKVPNGVTSIPYGFAICWNKNLKSIDFNQVESVGEYVMSVCHYLKEIRIPKTLTSIGEGAFTMFGRLEKFVVDPGNPNYSSDVNGVLFNKDKTQLLAYPMAREGEYTLPNTVTQIGKQAFLHAKITQLTIPSRITYIGYEAFRATKIKTLTFEEPCHITALNNREFLWCYDLKTVTLPKSLIYLGIGFSGCTNLETVNVPDGSQLKVILRGAFVNCGNLTNFNFLGSCNLQTIERNAFADMTKLKEFNFPASVTAIGANAFGNTPSMEKVTFKDNSTIISFGEGAFSNSGIKSIKIPASVKSIGKEAFKNCNVLERVDIPAVCTDIHPEAFKFDSKLVNINVDAANPKYSSVQGILLSKDKSELLIFPPGKARTDFTLLPPSITKIGNYAFYEGGNRFTNIVIPAKVNAIGIRAFGLNPALKTVTLLCDEMIPGSRIDQGENTMSFDNGKVAADDAKSHITVYVRKSLLDKYKSDPFWKNFTLKPSFTVKAEGTSAATDEYIPTSPTTVDFLSTTADVKTFVLPEQVKTDEGGTSKTYKVGLIGDYAFENANEHMKEVVVKAAVDYIGAMAFVTKTKRVAANGQSIISPVSTTIRQVIFTGNAPATNLSQKYFSLGAAFSEFFRGASGTGNCEQKIYVKKSKLSDYKAAWNNYAKALDYKIQGDGNAAFKINRKYGTFAREFDTDFSDYLTQKHTVKVAAFVAGTPILRGSGDYGKSSYHVRMTSVDLKGGVNGNYGYIPAGTGVLLKVLDKESTPADFYYTIGEHDNMSYSITENVMKGVTVNDAAVNASPGSPVYVMQDGMFRKAETPVNGFTVHKAYAKLGSLPAGAKVTFVFDDGEATGIENVDAAEDSEKQDVWYNLNGQRVSRPEHGVYIRNGKKVIIK